MFNTILSYLLGILCLANAGEVSSLFLRITNYVLAVLFIASGSMSGWRAARGE